MKRIVLVSWIIVLLLMLTSCVSGEVENNADNFKENANTSNSSENNVKDEPDLSMEDLNMRSAFSEGFAFADYDDDLVCIDKKGQIVFKVPDEYDLYRSISSGFNNGIAALGGFDSNDEYQIYFCRKDGSIIKPEDVGATKFDIAPSNDISVIGDMFEDGYILAYNIRHNDEGVVSVKEAGILSPAMEWIIPLSNSFYRTILSYAELNCKYHSGYIMRFGYGYLNLKTGEENSDFSLLYSVADIEYASDFWSSGSGSGVYDDRDGTYFNRESVIDMSIYEEEINVGFKFTDGIAPVFFGQKPNYKFTLLREDGSLCFEPVLVCDSQQSYDKTTGLYLVAYKNTLGDFVLDIFNTDGKVKTHTLDLSKYQSASAQISDGVIRVKCAYEKNNSTYVDNLLLTTDFTPLF